MNVVDLEILIPASPDFIWRIVGDLSRAAEWQAGVQSLSFLTTQQEGIGTRWRCVIAKGRDVVVEAAAWYDTVGYEYTVVDGAGYGSNGGRIRLHEVTEGTMVRWTFNYELNGVLGGIRNAVRKKRSARRQIQDSLRNLHELVLQEAGGITTHEAKASVREAPDAEQRSSYQPRHPSAFSDTGAMHASPLDGGAVDPEQAMILEPTLEPSLPPAPADGDTKPNPVVQISGAMAAAPPLPAPEADSTEPIEMDLIRFEPAAAVDEDEPLEPAPAPIAAEPDPIPPPEPAPFRRALDTSTVSVFEVFGFQKPSEAKLADASAEPVDDMDSVQRETSRLALRRLCHQPRAGR